MCKMCFYIFQSSCSCFTLGVECVLWLVQEHCTNTGCMFFQNGRSFHFSSKSQLISLKKEKIMFTKEKSILIRFSKGLIFCYSKQSESSATSSFMARTKEPHRVTEKKIDQKFAERCFHNECGQLSPQLSQLGYLEWL